MHVNDILERLSAWPDIVSTLRTDFHFDTRDTSGAGPRTVQRPVIEVTVNGTSINYLREYIESGHETPGIRPISTEQLRALDAVDEVLADGSLQWFTRLGPGDLMIINNRRVVHGRTDFVDNPKQGAARLLLRTWIDTREGPTVEQMPDEERW